MHRVLDAVDLAPGIRRMRVAAPRVARSWLPGQFAIVRPTPAAERIPLTIVGASDDEIELIVQAVGRTTMLINAVPVGEALADVVGPLGRPTEIADFGTVGVIGGGVGAAVALPVARALAASGNDVIACLGAKSRSDLILVDDFTEACRDVIVTTDDGSAGLHGTVTAGLEAMLAEPLHRVFAAGPIPMMRAVADLTRSSSIPTWVSLNPIMVDGTGMCGGCRVTVAGETRFACVDGPEFDAHTVDFDLLEKRNTAYRDFERCALERTLEAL